MAQKDKIVNSFHLVKFKKGEKETWRGRKRERCRRFLDLIFRERTSCFYLEIREIRPSTAFGTRRKATLRRKGFAWVPDLGSFLKLLEVGVSPYLVLFFV